MGSAMMGFQVMARVHVTVGSNYLIVRNASKVFMEQNVRISADATVENATQVCMEMVLANVNPDGHSHIVKNALMDILVKAAVEFVLGSRESRKGKNFRLFTVMGMENATMVLLVTECVIAMIDGRQQIVLSVLQSISRTTKATAYLAKT